MAAGNKPVIITLSAGAATAQIVPELGGGLATLHVDGKPALRPWSGKLEDGPFALACNFLAPFSNRLNGGFEWNDQRIKIEPNLAGEPFPIHGDAFQHVWTIAETQSDRVKLELTTGHIGPWRYAANLIFALMPQSLNLQFSLSSSSTEALPFGLGFHPWFPRDADTKLQFAAASVWLEQENYLRLGAAPISIPSELDFGSLRSLPDKWINNAYVNWDRTAHIEQGDAAVSLDITASDTQTTAIVYSPNANADFFCFEPVSHVPDAHNLPGYPGLATLQRSESITAQMKFSWNS